jgi:hypothetical protein
MITTTAGAWTYQYPTRSLAPIHTFCFRFPLPQCGRCQALTHKQTRCRRKATALLQRSGDDHQYAICELHWNHPPRRWW